MSYIGLNPNIPLLNTSTQYFSGTGATLQFALNRSVASASDLDVLIGNTAQRPGIDYDAEGTVLLFTSPPALGTNNITVNNGGKLFTDVAVSGSEDYIRLFGNIIPKQRIC